MKEDLQNKRTALLNAALELFSEQGIHTTPMSQIAECANIGVGTIYRYFPSKEALIFSLYEDVHSRIAHSVPANILEGVPAREGLIRYVSGIIHYMSQHPAELSLMEQYKNHPQSGSDDLEEVSSDSNETGFAFIFKKAMEEGKLKELPFEMLGAIIMGMIFSLSKYYLSKGGRIDEVSLKSGVEAIWDAISK